MPPTGPGTGGPSGPERERHGLLGRVADRDLVLADGTEVPAGSVLTDGQAHGAAADADTALTARWLAHGE